MTLCWCKHRPKAYDRRQSHRVRDTSGVASRTARGARNAQGRGEGEKDISIGGDARDRCTYRCRVQGISISPDEGGRWEGTTMRRQKSSRAEDDEGDIAHPRMLRELRDWTKNEGDDVRVDPECLGLPGPPLRKSLGVEDGCFFALDLSTEGEEHVMIGPACWGRGARCGSSRHERGGCVMVVRRKDGKDGCFSNRRHRGIINRSAPGLQRVVF